MKAVVYIFALVLIGMLGRQTIQLARAGEMIANDGAALHTVADRVDANR